MYGFFDNFLVYWINFLQKETNLRDPTIQWNPNSSFLFLGSVYTKMPLNVLYSSFFLLSVFQVSSTEKKNTTCGQQNTLAFCPRVRIRRERQGVGSCGVGEEADPGPHLALWLTYIWSFLSGPLEALAMSLLGPEAGYIIVALTSIPLGAFLLSTKTKLLVFIASFGIGTGKKWSYKLPTALRILIYRTAQQCLHCSVCKQTLLLPTISSLALHSYLNSLGKLIYLWF